MITFVCGQLCSGKSLYAKTLASIYKGIFVEVGDIVREVKRTMDRKLLQESAHLSAFIVEHLKVRTQFVSDAVISGVRQKCILEAFPEATLLWIDCPLETRKQRYSQRSREGDNILTFEEAEQGDIDLGILEVKQYIFNRV